MTNALRTFITRGGWAVLTLLAVLGLLGYLWLRPLINFADQADDHARAAAAQLRAEGHTVGDIRCWTTYCVARIDDQTVAVDIVPGPHGTTYTLRDS